MSLQPESRLTPQEYLIWERRQETRHEYFEGEVYAMTGASREHNLLTLNLAASLHAQLRGGPCEVYTNDMRVKVGETGIYTYPDVAVACERSEFEDEEVDTLLNPVAIIEVLSTSTEQHDRGAKFMHYRTLPSLQDCLLVAQTECRVEHFVRQPANRWLLTEYRGLDETIDLAGLGCRLLLRDVYERLAF